MRTSTILSKLVPILYEDDSFLVVVKPAGIDTGDARDGSPAGLAELLADVRGGASVRLSDRVARAASLPVDAGEKATRATDAPLSSCGLTVPPNATGSDRLPVPPLHASNRLSRYESGILVLGKNRGAAERIRGALKAGRVELEYAAVVLGRMASPRMVLGKEREPKPKERRPAREAKRRPPQPRKPAADSEAHTSLTLVRASEKRALVRCRTRVENTHALRAQLRAVSLRLVGDVLNDRFLSEPRARATGPVRPNPPGPSSWRSRLRQKVPQLTCLHLARMTVPNPQGGENLTLHAPAPDAFFAALEGEFDFERALHAAAVRRLRCFTESETDCFRLLTGNAEDVRGLVAEKYGPLVFLQIQEDLPALTEQLPRIAKWYLKTLGVQAVYVKRFVKDRMESDGEILENLHTPKSVYGKPSPRPSPYEGEGVIRIGSKPLAGKPVAEQIEVLERGLRFVIRPHAGFSVGLFLDQRENRSRVRSAAAGKQVLNLFAYTCGFSVAAAAGGAAQTVSVDASAMHLDWGQANFALNGIDPANHQFVRADSMEYLVRCARDEGRFDWVIIDPPTFAHGRRGKRRFSIAEDLAALIAGAVRLLNPGGVLLLSTNYRRLSAKELRDRLSEAAQGRPFKIVARPPLPDDFAMDPDHAKTILAQF